MFHYITLNQLVDYLQKFQEQGYGEREIQCIGCVGAGRYEGMVTPHYLRLKSLEEDKEEQLYFPCYQNDVK